MNKYIKTAASIAALLSITACGGGGNDDSYYEEEAETYYKTVVDTKNSPNSFICLNEGNNSVKNEYIIDTYLSSKEECEKIGEKWIAGLAKVGYTLSVQEKDALEKINKIRYGMGIPPLGTDKILHNIAVAHEKYIEDIYSNFGVNYGHWEDNDTHPSIYYTGITPSARFEYFGYDDNGAEVIAFDEYFIKDSIDQLMKAIYHRQALIYPRTTEIGFGGVDDYFAYVHEVGRDLEYEEYNMMVSPKTVKYPFDGQTDAQTTYPMHGEAPDPLPDVDHDAGNPIYVLFNDTKVGVIKNVSIELYDENGNKLESVLLNKENDPAKMLTEYEYALFSLYPLNPDTDYKAVLTYIEDNKHEDNKQHKEEWSFHTRPDEVEEE